MDAVAADPDQHVAFADRGAVDDLLALDHADAEADQLDVALRVHAGHRGRLAAEQRAAGAPTALGDAAQRVGGDLGVEAAHRHVVEEHERLGALHDEVVHDHRDAVDADGVVAPEL